jgi:Protein of unknown function (DUF4244)
MFPQPRYVFLDDTGSTTESAILMIVLAAFAAVLYGVVQMPEVKEGLTALIQRALNTTG